MILIKEILIYIKSLFKSRILPVALIFIIMGVALINRLFNLQIVNGSSFITDFTNSIEKTMSVQGTRGRIFDRNGVLLAYNDLAFSVKISDSGTYTENEEKNKVVNSTIEQTLNIIESKGNSFSNNFKIIYSEVEDAYSYTVSGNSLLRFQRDSYGKSTISKLSDEEKNSTASDMIDYLCKKYEVDRNQYSPNHLLEILYLRLQMTANSYNRYITFTISDEVSDETVAAILEHSDELVGVTVEEQYLRRYVDSQYCAQLMGYTGVVSGSELEELQQQDSSYESNDIVGKSGIEAALETELAGKKGSKTVYVDTHGRITQVIDQTDAQSGNDVYLTIDINLQKEVYNILESQITGTTLSYMTPTNVKYTYKTNGTTIDKIYITANEMYYDLIKNNMVSMSKIATEATATEASVHGSFVGYQSAVLSWVEDDLLNSAAPYGTLSEENQNYIWYIYQLLVKENILSTEYKDTDDTFSKWIRSDTLSLQEFLKYAIGQNWIDMSSLTDNKYSDLSEAYNILVSYILDIINTDSGFSGEIYKYMINNGYITGRQLCMLLYEQGFLSEDGYYDKLSSGAISSYDYIVTSIQTGIIKVWQLGLEPSSGSSVITDPNNGEILALVSYPGYDNNMLSGSVDADYYSQLTSYSSSPLLNRATQYQSAPGSTFKPITSIAGLDTGVIDTGTIFNCTGLYTEVTPNPQCWIYPLGHGDDNVVTALKDSCNVFFYSVGYRLAYSKNGTTYNEAYATSLLQKYAEMVGLATTTGIEIPEATPQASNILPIFSAIGQGNARYSALNLSHYVSTLASSGVNYNSTLIYKVTDSDGNTIREANHVISSIADIDDNIWDAVHSGMKLVIGQYEPFKGSEALKIAGKSGTAQENLKSPDHALFISYAPYDNPEIAVSVVIQNGYTSVNAASVTNSIYRYYFNYHENENLAGAGVNANSNE